LDAGLVEEDAPAGEPRSGTGGHGELEPGDMEQQRQSYTDGQEQGAPQEGAANAAGEGSEGGDMEIVLASEGEGGGGEAAAEKAGEETPGPAEEGEITPGPETAGEAEEGAGEGEEAAAAGKGGVTEENVSLLGQDREMDTAAGGGPEGGPEPKKKQEVSTAQEREGATGEGQQEGLAATQPAVETRGAEAAADAPAPPQEAAGLARVADAAVPGTEAGEAKTLRKLGSKGKKGGPKKKAAPAGDTAAAAAGSEGAGEDARQRGSRTGRPGRAQWAGNEQKEWDCKVVSRAGCTGAFIVATDPLSSFFLPLCQMASLRRAEPRSVPMGWMLHLGPALQMDLTRTVWCPIVQVRLSGHLRLDILHVFGTGTQGS
jgi:hypothetical protein